MSEIKEHRTVQIISIPALLKNGVQEKDQAIISKTATTFIHINTLKIAHRQAQSDACQVLWFFPYYDHKLLPVTRNPNG